MTHFSAVIFGIVEGFTEFLPISSTGHLMLTAHLLRIEQTDFVKSFEVAIQLGAILAVVVLYGGRLLGDPRIWRRVAAAFIPTAALGLAFYKTIKNVFLDSPEIVLWSLLLGGIFLVAFELFHRENKNSLDDLALISYPQAMLIGLFQSVALIPGVSRAAATILGGLMIGLKRKTIVEFSFLLAIPTMGAAAALDLWKSAGTFTADNFSFLATGFIVSFIVAMGSIRFLLEFIKAHNFIIFGIYRIAAAIFFLLAGI